MTDISLRYLLLGEDKSATSTIGKVGKAFNKVGSQVGGEFGEILDKVGEGIDKVGEHAHSMGAKITGAGTIVAGLGVAFQLAGSKEKQGAAQLDAAISATGASAEDYKESIEGAIKANEKYGFGAADTQQALMKLTAATNDPKVALQQMTTVANLAASQHESLATAASQVARVYGGSGKVLKQYGIQMNSVKLAASQLKAAESQHSAAVDGLSKAQRRLTQLEEIDHGKKKLTIGDQISLKNAHLAVKQAQEKVTETTKKLSTATKNNATATHATQDAINQLGKRLDGQAGAAVDSFGGKIRVVQTKIGDWTAQMGQKLGPALTIAGPAIMGVGTIIESGLVPKIASAIASSVVWIARTIASTAVTVAHGVAVGAVAVVTGVWTAAQWLLNAAMEANPILQVVVVIGLLIAVFILAYKHVTVFREVVNAAFHLITSVISATFNWVKGHWPLLLGILTGPVGLAIVWITKHWSTVTGLFSGAKKAIGKLLAGLEGVIEAPFKAAFKVIMAGFGPILSAISTVKSFLAGGSSNPTKGTTYGVSVPHPAARARGGPVRAGMPYIVGEHRPELFIPSQSGRISPSVGGGGGGDTYNITVNALTPEEAGAAVERVLVKRKSRQGRLAFQ